MENTHKPQSTAITAVGHFGMRFREGIFVIALITFVAYLLTS